jgi:hypothetical protein
MKSGNAGGSLLGKLVSFLSVSKCLSVCATLLLLASSVDLAAVAKAHSHHASHSAPVSHTATHTSSHTTAKHSGRNHHVAQSASSSSRRSRVSSSHRGRHQRVASRRRHGAAIVAHAPKPRYAYPVSIFMMHPPEFEHDQLPSELSSKIGRAFEEGHADEYAARSLVRAGLVSYHPLHGGMFWRREPVKYIIVHSTETGIPMGAVRVIDSWGSSGRRHAGAQYVVDRDGTIEQAVDPDLATVHVNIFKTLPGINNDNSIGIEMCHTGQQTYTREQRQSVIHLVAYLQDRYKVVDANVITHRYAQRGDHTDPVNFDWEQFIADKDRFRNQAIATKLNHIQEDATTWQAPEVKLNPPTVQNYSPAPVSIQPTKVLPTPTFQPDFKPPGTIPDLRGPIEVDSTFVQKLGVPSPASAPSNSDALANPQTKSPVVVQPAAPAVHTPSITPSSGVPRAEDAYSQVPGSSEITVPDPAPDMKIFIQPSIK